MRTADVKRFDNQDRRADPQTPVPGARRGRDAVILVHGLWMRPWAMAYLTRRLREAGFSAHAFGYRSVADPLPVNAERLARLARGLRVPALHFVGHSLGGVIIAACLHEAPDLPPGRAVFLGTPILGSHAARRLAASRVGRLALGHSMSQGLWPQMCDWPRGRELGVLAGSLGVGLGIVFAPGLPRPNDGAVAVAETQTAAAVDRIVLPVSHSGMLFSGAVARQVVHFLRRGAFAHEGSA